MPEEFTFLAYHKTSSVSLINSQNLNVSHLVLQLSLPNPLKPNLKLRMKIACRRCSNYIWVPLILEVLWYIYFFSIHQHLWLLAMQLLTNCCWNFSTSRVGQNGYKFSGIFQAIFLYQCLYFDLNITKICSQVSSWQYVRMASLQTVDKPIPKVMLTFGKLFSCWITGYISIPIYFRAD